MLMFVSFSLLCVFYTGFGRKWSLSFASSSLISVVFLQESTILFHDEATRNVSIEADKLLQTVIREEFRHCTIITVAHRLDPIMEADKIAVLDSGRLIYLDRPQELLSRECTELMVHTSCTREINIRRDLSSTGYYGPE